MTSRCLFGNGLSKKVVSLLGFCAVVWCVVGMTLLYESFSSKEPQFVQMDTYKPDSLLTTEKVQAGIYSLAVVQPFSAFGKTRYVKIHYHISKTIDGAAWVASRSVEINKRKVDIGASTFRTKRDAVEYISVTGRYIDYGKTTLMEVFAQ